MEEERDTTPVEIEVELPAWLDRFAIEAGLDLSQVLQDELQKRFGLQ